MKGVLAALDGGEEVDAGGGAAPGAGGGQRLSDKDRKALLETTAGKTLVALVPPVLASPAAAANAANAANAADVAAAAVSSGPQGTAGTRGQRGLVAVVVHAKEPKNPLAARALAMFSDGLVKARSRSVLCINLCWHSPWEFLAQ